MEHSEVFGRFGMSFAMEPSQHHAEVESQLCEIGRYTLFAPLFTVVNYVHYSALEIKNVYYEVLSFLTIIKYSRKHILSQNWGNIRI